MADDNLEGAIGRTGKREKIILEFSWRNLRLGVWMQIYKTY
jgi:hypothetical protein